MRAGQRATAEAKAKMSAKAKERWHDPAYRDVRVKLERNLRHSKHRNNSRYARADAELPLEEFDLWGY